MDDFGINTDALEDLPPIVLSAHEVRGGATIIMSSPFARWDERLAAQLMREAAPADKEPPDRRSPEGQAARRAAQVADLAPLVVKLEVAGVDRTADAASFLAALARLRPDVFDLRIANAPARAEPADPEPIAGNSHGA